MNPAVTAFRAGRILAQGPLLEVEAKVLAALAETPAPAILIFHDETGAQVDPRPPAGRAAEPSPAGAPSAAPVPPSVRGRPRLGVTAREVTLLPRHWDWLAGQRGGASAALRRLTDAAMRAPLDRRSVARAAAYAFMTAIAGDYAGFEEAARALFKDDEEGFARASAPWPDEVAAYAKRLAFGP